MNYNEFSETKELIQTIKNGLSEFTIFVWGMGLLGKTIVSNLYNTNKDLKITKWDKSLNNGGIYPDLESLTDNEKNNALFIAAIADDNIKRQIITELKNCGCKNIIGGEMLDMLLNLSDKDYQKALKDLEDYKALCDDDFSIDKGTIYLRSDWNDNAGVNLSSYYLSQDLWGARKVYQNKTAVHYDIGSRIDGFITHLLSFNQEVVLIDIRPLDTETYVPKGLSFIQADATNLENLENDSIESISALCSLEHFGLGRYGDPVDPSSHLKAFNSIQRVVKQGGNIYISVPVSNKNYVNFNSDRWYNPEFVVKQFDKCSLAEFSCTSEKGLLENLNIKNPLENNGYGLFHFVKN